MNILLDTHILLWALTGDGKLPGFAAEMIDDFVLSSLRREAALPKHNDPFDRIMLAQAKAEGYQFLTHDTLIAGYQEKCVIFV